MICVKHAMGSAKTAADCMPFMDAGEIMEGASPRDFVENTRDKRTRKFYARSCE